jgi:predicted dehydrogenase
MNTDQTPSGITRRGFIRRASAAGGAVVLPWLVPARALGRDGVAAASERIGLGVIGFGARGQYDLGALLPETDVHCLAVCDVVRERRDQGKQMVDAHYGNQDCATYTDLRELLARPDIDAVLIATGDRWHTQAALLAAKAGKDVYCEKPCGLTMGEVQALAQGIQRYARIFQCGTQRRSVANFQRAIRLAQNGTLGRLHTLHASITPPHRNNDWLPAEPEPARDQCDWDLWLGPATWRPYNPRYLVGRGWQGYCDFAAAGAFLDWGVHTVDLCQWANQSDHTLPTEYEATPTAVVARYANGVKLVCDILADPWVNRLPYYLNTTGSCPVRFEGDEGSVETGDNGDLALSANLEKAHRGQLAGSGLSPAGHGRNFLDCVRSRALPICNQNIMLRSHQVCFAAHLAWYLGRKLTIDPATTEFVDDAEANRMRRRALREPWSLHL